MIRCRGVARCCTRAAVAIELFADRLDDRLAKLALTTSGADNVSTALEHAERAEVRMTFNRLKGYVQICR